MNNTYSKVVTLTPHLAKELLANRYEGQRTISMSKAAAMARDISDGRWNDSLYFSDPLMVSSEGKLMNGQHRCQAVIIANKSISVTIYYNVPVTAFENIDGGYTRTAVQFVKTKNAQTVIALARFANAIENGANVPSALIGAVSRIKNHVVTASRAEILEYVDAHSDELEFFGQEAKRITNSLNGGSSAGVADALWLISYVRHWNMTETSENIKRFTDDVCANIPQHPAIAAGKSYAMGRQVAAARDHVRIHISFWVALILAMYESFGSRKIKISKKDLDKAMALYCAMIGGECNG